MSTRTRTLLLLVAQPSVSPQRDGATDNHRTSWPRPWRLVIVMPRGPSDPDSGLSR